LIRNCYSRNYYRKRAIYTQLAFGLCSCDKTGISFNPALLLPGPTTKILFEKWNRKPQIPKSLGGALNQLPIKWSYRFDTIQTLPTTFRQKLSIRFFFQVFLRCISFVLNVFVLHNVDKALLGIVNVRLVLLIMSILFISRESFRKSCMNKTKDQNWPQVVNLLWLT